MKLIHWLASYPKSGNTWARLFYQAYVTGNAAINANLRTTLTDSYEPMYQGVTPVALANLENQDFALLRGAALVNLIANSLRSHLVVKTHNAHIEVNGVPLFPSRCTASAVYLVRDPRDVACSYASHLDMDIDAVIEILGDQYSALRTNLRVPQFTCSWSKHVQSWTDKALVIRYEDLCVNPVHWFSKMLETWGIEPDAERVAEAVEMTTMDKFQQQEAEEGFIEIASGKFFRKGGSHWRDTLTNEQAQRIRKHHAPMMARYNYG